MLKNIFLFTLELKKRYTKHNITAFSAQMAYFFTLSIFPFLILLISLFSKFDITQYFAAEIFKNVLPLEVEIILKNYIDNLIRINSNAIVPFTAVFTLWSASRGVNSLMRSLNIAYDVKENRNYVQLKLLGMLYTASLSIALIIAILIPNIGKTLLEITSEILRVPNFILVIVKWGFFIISIYVILTSLYVFLPNKKITFKSVIPGSIFSIFGWFIVSKGFSYFVANFSNFSIIYGSLTAIIVFMMWLYISSIILMLGGEINSIYSNI